MTAAMTDIDIKAMIRRKAAGIVSALSTMSPKEREFPPTPEFGRDYNKLQELAKQHFPQLADLLPPQVRVDKSATYARYVEIHAYAEQIHRLVADTSSGRMNV